MSGESYHKLMIKARANAMYGVLGVPTSSSRAGREIALMIDWLFSNKNSTKIVKLAWELRESTKECSKKSVPAFLLAANLILELYDMERSI